MRWIFFLGLACSFVFATAEKSAIELSVQAEGVRSDAGNLLVLLFDKKKGFPAERKHALQVLTVPAKSPKVVAVFRGLASGTYAVCVIHDENGDGELDTNFLGIPREGVGVSRDAKGSFGPPAYEDAALEISQSGLIQLQLKYL